MEQFNQIKDDVSEVQQAIVMLREKVVFAKKFKELYDDPKFQDIIMDTILGTELDMKAKSLALDLYMDKEREEETLIVLRSMRYLNQIIQEKLADAERAPMELAMNEDYLRQLVAEQEE